MHIFVCLDETGGMTFNRRRQSSDRVIREDILQTVGEKNLYVNDYTAKQFTEDKDNRLIADDGCLKKANAGDYVFIENSEIAEYASKIESITVYRWKRKYPADTFFDIDLTSSDWKVSAADEIKGYSHETIGKEIYVRKE